MKTEETEPDIFSEPKSGFRSLLIFIVTTILFWVSMYVVKQVQGLIVNVILKFIVYMSVILWLNSGFYLRELVRGIDVETGDFQKSQVKLTTWVILILILMELPLWIVSLSDS